MEQPAFYDKEKAKLREDFFRGNFPNSSYINDIFFDMIFQEMPLGSRILDIGTGNAFVLEQLSRKYPQRYVLYGIDNSEEMLKKAEDRTKGMDITLVLGDNLDLPFQADFFDGVTAKNVTNFSEAEVYRALRGGGKFIFREYGAGKGLREIVDLFIERLVRSRDPTFYIGRLEKAGFKNILLKEFFVKRDYSFEELVNIIQMFPFLDKVEKKDTDIICAYFSGRKKAEITSDQILIIGEK